MCCCDVRCISNCFNCVAMVTGQDLSWSVGESDFEVQILAASDPNCFERQFDDFFIQQKSAMSVGIAIECWLSIDPKTKQTNKKRNTGMAGVLGKFKAALKGRPLVTNCISYGLLYAGAEFSQQTFIRKVSVSCIFLIGYRKKSLVTQGLVQSYWISIKGQMVLLLFR